MKNLKALVEKWDRGEPVASVLMGIVTKNGVDEAFERVVQVAAMEMVRAAVRESAFTPATFKPCAERVAKKFCSAIPGYGEVDPKTGLVKGSAATASSWLAWKWVEQGGEDELVAHYVAQKVAPERFIRISSGFEWAKQAREVNA